MSKFQVPTIGGIRKVIHGPSTGVGTTIAEVGSGTITLEQLAAAILNILTNTSSIVTGQQNAGVLVPGPGLSGGGVLVGNVPIRLTAPIPWFDAGDGGADGDPGPPGVAGAKGATGAGGPVGPVFVVDDGADGDLGPPGPPGPTGAQGNVGTTGGAGPQGPPGAPGDDGVDGDQGPPGAAGAKGATGNTGAQGPTGPVFIVDDGIDGEPGTPGAAGPAGATGSTGSPGIQGPSGALVLLGIPEDGADGDVFLVPGPIGPQGATGATGTTGASGTGSGGTSLYIPYSMEDGSVDNDMQMPSQTLSVLGPTVMNGPQQINGVLTVTSAAGAGGLSSVVLGGGNNWIMGGGPQGIFIMTSASAGFSILQSSASVSTRTLLVDASGAIFGPYGGGSTAVVIQNNGPSGLAGNGITISAGRNNVDTNFLSQGYGGTPASQYMVIYGDGSVTIGTGGVSTLIGEGQGTLNVAKQIYINNVPLGASIHAPGMQMLADDVSNDDGMMQYLPSDIQLHSLIINQGGNGLLYGLTIYGAAGTYTELQQGSRISGQSFGPLISAGTTSTDSCFSCLNASGTVNYLFIAGDGHGSLATNMTWDVHGAFTIATPTAGTALTIYGTQSVSNEAFTVYGSTTTGKSLGVFIQAGTTSTDTALYVRNATGSQNFLTMYGDGHGFMGGPTGGSLAWDANGAFTIATPSSASVNPLIVYGSNTGTGIGANFISTGENFLNVGVSTNSLAVGQQFMQAAVVGGFFGLETLAGGDLIVGATQGDLCYVVDNKNLRMSVNNGSTSHLTLTSTSLTLTPPIGTKGATPAVTAAQTDIGVTTTTTVISTTGGVLMTGFVPSTVWVVNVNGVKYGVPLFAL